MKFGLTRLVLQLASASVLAAAEPSLAPDYFCTWNVQGSACSYSGASVQADMMVEASLFDTGTNQNWQRRLIPYQTREEAVQTGKRPCRQCKP
jgi:hypothetical protein